LVLSVVGRSERRVRIRLLAIDNAGLLAGPAQSLQFALGLEELSKHALLVFDYGGKRTCHDFTFSRWIQTPHCNNLAPAEVLQQTSRQFIETLLRLCYDRYVPNNLVRIINADSH